MSKQKTETFEVESVEIQPDRALVHKKGVSGLEYYAITSVKIGNKLKPGDTIVCKPEGVNFGWYVRKINTKRS